MLRARWKKVLVRIVVVAVIGGALVSAPLLPLSALVKYGPVHIDREYLAGHIAEDDIASILRAVRQHDHLGRSFEQATPRYTSLVDYVFVYDRIGTLSIELCGPEEHRSCGDYSARVTVGIVCGLLCGWGELFCVKGAGESWEAEFCGEWVS